jgi:hypothetical protein
VLFPLLSPVFSGPINAPACQWPLIQDLCLSQGGLDQNLYGARLQGRAVTSAEPVSYRYRLDPRAAEGTTRPSGGRTSNSSTAASAAVLLVSAGGWRSAHRHIWVEALLHWAVDPSAGQTLARRVL